jgi:hypothetical protein
MKYFIYVNDEIKEVPEAEYEAWYSLEGENYNLPDYSILIDGNQYSIETKYVGALDKDEWDNPMPFVLFYFEDEYKIHPDGIRSNHDKDIIEYFKSFDELVKYRNDLIQKIESRIKT